MKNLIKKILFKLMIINNNIFCKINKNKFKYKVAIVSCNKWINKVKEDKCLKIELNKKYIDVDIISWEEDNNLEEYDALIIRSIWGYQDNIDKFCDWIKHLTDKNIKVFNNTDILTNNLNKYTQFKLLDKYNIPHIDTIFLGKDELNKINNLIHDEVIVKPIISGGGNNTYIVTSDKDKKNSIDISSIKDKYKDILNDKNNYLMIQPFVKEIYNGELSIVYIDGKISHAAYRYTNTFNNYNTIKVVETNSLDKDAIEISKNISKIKEYTDYLYMRVDLVKIDNSYKVMEVELVEPQLFLEYRTTKKALKSFANAVNNKIKKKNNVD